MGKTGTLGARGALYGFVHGQGVKIRPKGDLRPVRAGAVKRVKPAPPINHFKGGIGFQKIEKPFFGPPFPAG
jgi:hypothetical protein